MEPAQGLPALLGTIALELARTGALPGPLRLGSLPPRLTSSAGRLSLVVPPGTTALVLMPGRVRVEHPGGAHEPSLAPDDAAFVALAGSAVRLALVDDNPLAALEAHPEKRGNAIDLGGQPVARWKAALEQALGLVERYLPAFRAEIEAVLQQVVPVGWDDERHLSASVQEAIGTVYLSLHPNPMTMAEAVIHEVSHNKLAALFELDPVLHNDRAEAYASPVRPDPRPLRGVLLAVHAFLPVAALYAAMIEAEAPGSEHPAFRQRLARIVAGNHEGAAVLRAHARPTARGAELLAEVEALDRASGRTGRPRP
jgi:HEXXH motif-containing protein